MKKEFDWQAKNEKLLFFSRENIFYYFYKNLNKILLLLMILLLLLIIWFFLNAEKYIIFIMLIVIILFIYIFAILWHKTHFVVTNKRIIKVIKNWLFSKHTDELKIDQINKLVFLKKWIISEILKIWNIKIVWKDKEATVYFTWIYRPDEIIQYISRLRDFLFENPDFDFNKINKFKTRTERKK